VMCHWICCGSQLGIYFFLLNKIVSLWSLEFKGQHEIKKKKKNSFLFEHAWLLPLDNK